MLARTPLWEQGLDFNHGTGHGVGYLLNVHEGPVNISVHAGDDSRRNCIFKEGMVTSDEPGYYEEGAFGIRLENLLVCKQKTNFGNGRFLCFETLTMVPFDLDAVLPELLTQKEKEWLNDYHANVWNKLIPFMKTVDEQRWLTEATRAI